MNFLFKPLWDDKIWLSKGNVMNDDYDALLYFDKAKITAHVLQAINEFSRFASGKVSWEELPQIVQYFFPREVLCQMMEAIAHITVGDTESYLRHFEAFSRNAIKAYSENFGFNAKHIKNSPVSLIRLHLQICGDIMHPQVQDFPLDITFEAFHVLIL